LRRWSAAWRVAAALPETFQITYALAPVPDHAGYFCGSYGFREPFTTAYAGTTLPDNDQHDPPNYWSLYRWHVPDPIAFEQDLKVTIQALGWGEDRKYKLLSDNIASVAYWYQAEPHAAFPPMPPLEQRGRSK